MVAHALVNAALAVAQGNNALAGAAGAATGEVVGMRATQMYGKPVSELSEAEKQTVSTLATVAAGLAGGLVGDSERKQQHLSRPFQSWFRENGILMKLSMPL